MAPGAPRLTLPTQLVLAALLADPERELYGKEIGGIAGLPSGTVHPILARLENFGWLESRWEHIDPHEEGRPRRRYYRLSTQGAAEALEALRQRHGAPAARQDESRPAPTISFAAFADFMNGGK